MNQLRQQCPSPYIKALHFCRIHWQLGASSVLHKPNDSPVSCSRPIHLCEICPYLSAPNDTSQRIYGPFTIWEIYWETILYHKKNRQFLRWKFLRSDCIEWEMMCPPLKIIRRLGHQRWLKGVHPLRYMVPICDASEEFIEALFHKDMPRKGNKCAPWTILKFNVLILTWSSLCPWGWAFDLHCSKV